MLGECRTTFQSLIARLMCLGALIGLLAPVSPHAFAEESRVSIRSIQESGHKISKLQGPWQFYWKRLLKPGDPLPEPDAYSSANTYWVDLSLKDGTRPSRTGFGSYRLVLEDFPDLRQEYTYLHRALPGSGEVFLYPEDRPEDAYQISYGWSQTGKLSPELKSIQKFLEIKQGQRWVILIQVQYPKAIGWKSGGLFTAPEISLKGESQRIYQFTSFELAFSMGLASFVALASVVLWLQRRAELASLYLGLFSSLFAMRLLFYFGLFFTWWAPPLRFTLLFDPWSRIALVSALIQYFFYSFPQAKLSLKLMRAIQASQVLAALLTLFAALELIPIVAANRITSMSHLLGIGLCLLIAIRAFRTNTVGLGLLTFGFAAVLITGIHDFYYNYHKLSPDIIPLLPAGVSLFLFSQTQLVAFRFARSFRQVEEYAREIADKEKARTLFFQNTSHELRTPLNGILGFLELMRAGRYGAVSDKLAQQITKCQRLAEGLKFQVDTILDIAKARRGGLATRMQKLSLEDLLAKTNTLAEGLVSRSSHLSYSAELDLADREYPFFISDREKIFAILRNLIGNAIKFSDPQRPNHVRLRLSVKDKELTIEVHDQGIGIAPEHHQRIFEEFSQVESHAQRRFEGTGLGLTMVRDFVQVLGGKIELQSNLGRGTSFLIMIPEGHMSLAVDDSRTEQTLIQSLDKASSLVEPIQSLQPTTIGHGWDILVIDDNASNCELIADILAQDSFHVRTALSGKEGLRSMRREKPQVVLLDMMMPEMSGEDVLKEIRADSELADVAVVIITARADDEDRYLGLSLGADDYLAKPIFAAELRLRIQNLIHRQKLVLQGQQLESQAKLSQLGELFRDLSHELKNIFQGGMNGGGLNPQQIDMALDPLSIEHLKLPLIRQSLLDGSCLGNEQNRTWSWKKVSSGLAADNPQLRSLTQLLAAFPFSEQEWIALMEELNSTPAEELLFLENQLFLLYQVRSLQQSILIGRELALSTLAYTRAGGVLVAHPGESLRAVRAMTEARLRRFHIALQVDLDDRRLAIPPGHLMQILLNLVLNAIDAVQNLDPSERWIRIKSHSNSDHAEIIIENGGPAIPPEVQDRLFHRGFSTKGAQGSGIGLHVSSKLAREAHGDLSYDRAAAHPRFILLVPSAREEDSVA